MVKGKKTEGNFNQPGQSNLYQFIKLNFAIGLRNPFLWGIQLQNLKAKQVTELNNQIIPPTV